MSIRSSTGPPNKRKRLNGPQDESFPEKDITRSEAFWFEDGSVVLQAENTQFRVHRTILAAKSDFFRDMFMLPQPEDQPTVEGSPLVVCAQDSARDWANVLTYIYNSMELEQDRVPFRFTFLASMVRLGNKYQMDRILRAGMARLERGIPTHRNKGGYWWTWNFFRDMTEIFAYINLAEELSIQSLLPMCYFACVSRATMTEILDGIPSPRGNNRIILSAGTQRMLLLARDDVLHSRWLYAMGWLATAVEDYAGECRNGKCRRSIGKVLKSCGTQSILSPHLNSDRWWSSESLFDELCSDCAPHARLVRDAGMDDLWEEIPGYFNLPGWEDLRDFAV